MHCLILVRGTVHPPVSLGFREDVSEADWLHLTDGEEVRWSGRPSQYTLVPATLTMVLLVVLGVVLTAWWQPTVAEQGWPWLLGYLPLLIGTAGIAYAIWVYLLWLRLLYVITDEEIYVKLGLVSRNVTQVPLTRVQNTSYDQSVLQRLLSYGNIYVYTAGTHTDDLLLRNVPRPERIKGILTAQLSERHSGQSATDVP